MNRLRTLVLATALGATAVQAAPPSAPAPPTGLAPGTAKGTITVDGKPVTLGYAYAMLEPNPFDETRHDDIVVLLTEKPIAAEVLGGKRLSRSIGAARLDSFLLVAFRADQGPPAPWVFLGKWVVGNRTLGHVSLKERRLMRSPDMDSRVDPVVVGKERVEATVSSKGPSSEFDHQVEYRVAFNAAVRPRVP